MRVPSTQDTPSLPEAPRERLWPASEICTLSADGSFCKNSSGWGFTVSQSSNAELSDFCGPVVLDPQASDFVGASRHTNNVGELCALLFALHWIHDHVALESFVLEFDSMYASDAIRRRSRTRTNLSLVLRARSVLDSIMSKGAKISWHKVEAHVGFFLNERADQLAGCGSAGICVGGPLINEWARRAA